MSVMHQIGRNLKKEEHSTYNRLLSIVHDSAYVEAFAKYAYISPLMKFGLVSTIC